MSVNEFEKQAQQKMNELQLRPSEGVWTEVEKRIRKKKKRRRIIIWFLFCGIMLMGGAAWWITGSKTEPLSGIENVKISDKKTNELKPSEQSHPTREITTPAESPNKTDPKKVQLSVKRVNDQAGDNVLIPVNDQNSKMTLRPVNSTMKRINKPGQPTAKSDKTKMLADQKLNPEKEPVQLRTNMEAEKDRLANRKTIDNMQPGDTVTAGSAENKNMNDKLSSVSDTQISRTKADSVSVNKVPETVSEKDPAVKKKNKWEWGIIGQIGISYRSKGISIFNGQKSADLSSSPGTTPQARDQPVDPARGFSWKTGIYAKRILTERTGLSAGLEFTSFSTRQKTGVYVDSSRVIANSSFSSMVGDFYRTGNRSTYTNHYYYLQLPIIFHWQLNKGVKKPLVWQNGFSIGLLTGSDALIFSESSNLYYRDNRLLNKVQFSYQTGISMRFFNRSTHPFTAGLNFHYPLSRLQKINPDDRNQLASFGVQFGWILKK